MDICHLKNAELEPHFQKYKGRVVLRGDTVKDDSGAHAVSTAQGSSASQNDSDKRNGRRTSIHSSKDGGCSQTARNSKVRMSRYTDTSSTTQVAQNRGQTLKIQWFLMERNLYGHPLAGLL